MDGVLELDERDGLACCDVSLVGVGLLGLRLTNSATSFALPLRESLWVLDLSFSGAADDILPVVVMRFWTCWLMKPNDPKCLEQEVWRMQEGLHFCLLFPNWSRPAVVRGKGDDGAPPGTLANGTCRDQRSDDIIA